MHKDAKLIAAGQDTHSNTTVEKNRKLGSNVHLEINMIKK